MRVVSAEPGGGSTDDFPSEKMSFLSIVNVSCDAGQSQTRQRREPSADFCYSSAPWTSQRVPSSGRAVFGCLFARAIAALRMGRASVIPMLPFASASHAARHGGAGRPRNEKFKRTIALVGEPPKTPLPSQSPRRNGPVPCTPYVSKPSRQRPSSAVIWRSSNKI